MALIDTAKIGALGGKARAGNMSAQELSNGASQAANARWEAYYAAHPEKLKEKQERDARKTAGKVKRGRPKGKKAAK